MDNTIQNIRKFVDYAATHPDAILTYRKSHMVRAVHSDAPYLSGLKVRSLAGGYFFVASDTPIPSSNQAVLNTAQLIKTFMSSAAETKMGASFLNA